MRWDFRKCLAEAIGTFALVFAGTGAIVVDGQTGALGNLGIALAFGSVVGMVIYSIGHVSGAHINPAVTIALWSGRRFHGGEVLPYILSQLSGAVLGSLAVFLILGGESNLGATFPRNGDSIPSFFLELVLTFLLMFVILGSTEKRAHLPLAGAAIGIAVFLDALFGGPVSGASMNPARSFGPALMTGSFEFHWLYWVAPVTGALTAVWAHHFIRNPMED